VVDADDLEQPEKELAKALLWPVPDALGGCSDAADAVVSGSAGLGAMPTFGGAVGTHVVIGHTSNGSLRSPAKSPHNRSSRLPKSGGGMDGLE
jgi:hypothetical protein